MHFGGVYSEGLKCAGAYSVWNFVRGGVYFRNFVSHKKNLCPMYGTPGGFGYRFLVSSRTHWGMSSRSLTSLRPVEVTCGEYTAQAATNPYPLNFFQNRL